MFDFSLCMCACVFVRLRVQLVPPTSVAGDMFGASISIYGVYFVSGAPLADVGAADNGQ